jgi:membrane protease YdiL (CAAX protease family)
LTAPPPDDPASADPSPATPAPADPSPGTPEGSDPAPNRPGASTFTIEGRAAPGLFVVGWLATLLGFGAVLVAFMGGAGQGFPIVLIGGLVVLSIGLVAGAGGQAIERKARGGRQYVGPSPFLVFAAAIPISSLLGIGVGAVLALAHVPVEGPMAALASVILQAFVYIGLIRLLVTDNGALTWADMHISRFSGRAVFELVLGAGWALPVIVATLPVAYLISQFIPTPPPNLLPPTGDPVGFAMNMLAAAVFAPIGEEILFRGFSTTAWVRDMGIQRGLVRGALFFALAHILTISGSTAGDALGQAVAAFLGRLPIAFALGYLFLQRGSIYASLGLHATFNAILLILQEVAFRNGVPSA